MRVFNKDTVPMVLSRSALLDPQVVQQPVERLLVGVVILPPSEVANLQELNPQNASVH
jgi:hypothetical protein